MQKRGLRVGGKKGISDSENKRKYVLFSASKIAKNRHAISEVVTTVLMVLLALGAILLVWFLVRNLISNAGEQIDLSKLTLSFTIPGNSVYVNQPMKSVSFVVHREAGQGTVSGLKVIVTDTGGQSVTQNVLVALGELESKSVSISYAGSSLGKIAKVSVAPIVKSASGNEQTGSVAAEYSVTDTNVISKALKYDGITNFVDAGDKPSLRMGMGSLSVSFWINPSKFNGLHSNVSIRPVVKDGWRADSLSNYWLVILDDGDHNGKATIGFQAQGLGGNAPYVLSSSEVISPNQLAHVAVVLNRATNKVRFYINGTFISEAGFVLTGGLDVTGYGVRIGDSYDPMAGILSDVRIYNTALGDSDVANLYHGDGQGSVAKDNLVGRWKFDGDYKDYSGNGNDGTPSGAAMIFV